MMSNNLNNPKIPSNKELDENHLSISTQNDQKNQKTQPIVQTPKNKRIFFREKSTLIIPNNGSYQPTTQDLTDELRKNEKNLQNQFTLQSTKTTQNDTPPINVEDEKPSFENQDISQNQKNPLNTRLNPSPILHNRGNSVKENGLINQVLKTPQLHQKKKNESISPRYPLSTHTPLNDIIIMDSDDEKTLKLHTEKLDLENAKAVESLKKNFINLGYCLKVKVTGLMSQLVYLKK
ncbi:hypothetical protein M0813_03154 [Anaeramoeba flamelloides]|uniref:Uncharacterized protein n=1 Tax=Anaeramoeba flamelloides TaxID=1746091 RepID=A0ABQ8Y3X0_9EUKA|nr:hypothetical protein M0813_03154 [Anaeramoeba flamelloides]